MKKTFLYAVLMISIINVSFAIPAKPFKLLANKEYKFFDVKLFDEQQSRVASILSKKSYEPIKSLSNSKISLKATLDENYKAKLSWVSAVGKDAKLYVIQISHDRETFYDLIEVKVDPKNEERSLYTFVDPKMYIGTKYYRIMEIYAPVKITLDAVPAPSEIVRCLQTDENNVIHIKTGDSRLVPILTTETGMGIPCDYKYSEATQTGVLKPLYYLAGGNYHLKVRMGNNEAKYVVSVNDLEGMQF
jgi:hypothetical protein